MVCTTYMHLAEGFFMMTNSWHRSELRVGQIKSLQLANYDRASEYQPPRISYPSIVNANNIMELQGASQSNTPYTKGTIHASFK